MGIVELNVYLLAFVMTVSWYLLTYFFYSHFYTHSPPWRHNEVKPIVLHSTDFYNIMMYSIRSVANIYQILKYMNKRKSIIGQ